MTKNELFLILRLISREKWFYTKNFLLYQNFHKFWLFFHPKNWIFYPNSQIFYKKWAFCDQSKEKHCPTYDPTDRRKELMFHRFNGGLFSKIVKSTGDYYADVKQLIRNGTRLPSIFNALLAHHWLCSNRLSEVFTLVVSPRGQ